MRADKILLFSDVQDLPEALLKELNISDSMRLNITIFDIFKENGGEASVDDVLIGIFRKTGNVIKRHSVVARLYRMKKNGIIARKNLKGAYVLKKG